MSGRKRILRRPGLRALSIYANLTTWGRCGKKKWWRRGACWYRDAAAHRVVLRLELLWEMSMTC
jgi:hypothetical protein